MKGKLLFVAGAAAGYVLGARAGRHRYEQIKDTAEKVWNTPTVQKGADAAKGFAMERVSVVSDAVLDGAKKLIGAATNAQKSSETRASSSSSARTTPATATATASGHAHAADASTSATKPTSSKASTAEKE